MDRRVDCLANSLLLARGSGLRDLIEPFPRCLPSFSSSCSLAHPHHRRLLCPPPPLGICSQEYPPPSALPLSLHRPRRYPHTAPLRCRVRVSESRCDMLAFELGRVSGLRGEEDLGGRRGARLGRLWGQAWQMRGRGR